MCRNILSFFMGDIDIEIMKTPANLPVSKINDYNGVSSGNGGVE